MSSGFQGNRAKKCVTKWQSAQSVEVLGFAMAGGFDANGRGEWRGLAEATVFPAFIKAILVHRQQGMATCRLDEILLLRLLAVLAGAETRFYSPRSCCSPA